MTIVKFINSRKRKQSNRFLVGPLVLSLLALFFYSNNALAINKEDIYKYPLSPYNNKDGYPIFAMTCDGSKNACFSEVGEAKDLRVIAENMPMIRVEDLKKGYKCLYVCTDPQGNVVGSDPLTTHKKVLEDFKDYRFVHFSKKGK